MLLPKNVIFLFLLALSHIVFSKMKTRLLGELKDWWHQFIAVASKFISEDELNQRLSFVQGGRPSVPFMKMNQTAFHDLTNQVTRGSILLDQSEIQMSQEEMEVRYSYPYIFLNQFQ